MRIRTMMGIVAITALSLPVFLGLARLGLPWPDTAGLVACALAFGTPALLAVLTFFLPKE